MAGAMAVRRLSGRSVRGAMAGAMVLVAVAAAMRGPAVAAEDGERDDKVDTQFIFGFTMGAGVGEVGERELEHQTQGQWSKPGGQYVAATDQLRFEHSPFENFRFEVGVPLTYYQIAGIPGLDDRRQGAFNGFVSEFRYRVLDGEHAPFQLTLGAEPHWARTDEVSGAPVDNFGGELSVALDRELVPGRLFGAVNLVYEPEVSRARPIDQWQRESTAALATSVVAQLAPGMFFGAEARYLRKYDGLGFDTLLGDAVFVGPNTYLKLTKTLAISAAWGIQVAGHAAGAGGGLDVANFTRQQALLRVEYNF